ncbi:MAG: glycosyltransferase [Solirubrobacterales bacterium]|nr:glycosyltransferase [Solirubrobacterales bacterium]
MSAPTLDISVIIPAYCEEVGIAHTVTSVHEQLSAEGLSFEIIVVDNASTDETVRTVQDLHLSDVSVLVNETNRGKGWSVRRGMLDATGALRLHCDADCAPSLASLNIMRDLITAGADVVVGSRLGPGADIGQKQPLMRRAAGSSFQTLCRIILREPTRDRFCGFKLWKASAAEDVFSNLSLEGWTFDAEALALARRLGYGVVETGIVWADREGSRLSMLKVLFPVTRELLAARKNVKRVTSARGKEGVDRLSKPVDHVPGESRVTADPD